MNVEALNSTAISPGTNRTIPEQLDFLRKEKERVAESPQAQTEPQNSKVQPEELLEQIKSLTQDGVYSVRFETSDSELVVKIFDNESQEVIRQIPAEELLNFKATFNELLGNIVNTEG